MTPQHSTEPTLILNAFLMSTGHHEASWRLPESDPAADASVEHFQQLARIAERGKMDSVFFADSPSLLGDTNNVARRPPRRFEPTLLLSAMAAVTERVGLIATATTTYDEPYNTARRFASLDGISHGRAGWNVVTTASPDASANFGYTDQPSHAERYERAEEYLEVVLGPGRVGSRMPIAVTRRPACTPTRPRCTRWIIAVGTSPSADH